MLTTAFHCLLLFGKHIFCHVSQKWGLRPAHPGCTMCSLWCVPNFMLKTSSYPRSPDLCSEAVVDRLG